MPLSNFLAIRLLRLVYLLFIFLFVILYCGGFFRLSFEFFGLFGFELANQLQLLTVFGGKILL